MGTAMFRGIGAAMITPFADGGVDYASFGRMIGWQIREGVDFLVVLGTTGEAPTISESEREEIISFAVSCAAGRVPIVAGCGGNSTEHALRSCVQAASLGADGALVVTPYYNKPTQEGIFRHYAAVAEAGLPIIAYNVPGRTGVNMSAATAARVAASLPGVVALKEASGNIGQADEEIAEIKKIREDFSILSGNDDQAFHMINSGGDGLISVLSNVAPSEAADMVARARRGDVAGARRAHLSMLRLTRDLFMESNPIPVKYAASRLGLCENRLRLPLTPAGQACRARIDEDIAALGLSGLSGVPAGADAEAVVA